MKRIFGFIGIIAVALFAFGCSKPEQTVEVPEVIEEPVVLEPAPEPVVEEPEEVETPISETVENVEEAKYDYTAEGITNLYIDIFNNNGYFERDEAWALVIAANMDNIAEEDFNKLLEEHDFSVESLGESYYNCMDKLNSIKVNKRHSASYGGDLYYGIDENLLKLYDNESIKLDNLFIDEEYNQYCMEIMEKNYYNLEYVSPQGELGSHLDNALTDNKNSSDVSLLNLDLVAFGTDSLSEEIINPYNLILEKEFTR